MAQRFDYILRLAGTSISFSIFGIGGFILGFFVFPIIHLTTSSRKSAYRRCRMCVYWGFRFFVFLMEFLGVLSVNVKGQSKLSGRKNVFLLANHPSLIDVVVIGSLLPQLVCVTKGAVWRNPFTAGIMWGAGYINNDQPVEMINCSTAVLGNRGSLLLFPEGTRTKPGQPINFKRGAARVAMMSDVNITPAYITLRPETLSKGEKWYDIPDRRVEYIVAIGNDICVDESVDDFEETPIAVRRVNENWKITFGSV